MKDSLGNPGITVESFKSTLIVSEILITAITMVGFYLIFNYFNKKNKEFQKNQNKS